ncbi:hypothetical protein PAXINDRAFT_173397 [Paxillus involutus ATCC 200175]|uniref:Uncharacterized protein n=1 Tax=Paxillus involutus ATCC 200175 TaxID=664439 RepID=A0A0C9SXF0_PAXIN|nr:hypothetical protein PAXINDRAFT_173397 [Paxillus involutus ATCC 200175]
MESAAFVACLVTMLAVPLATFNIIFLSDVLIAGRRYREMSAETIMSRALSEVHRSTSFKNLHTSSHPDLTLTSATSSSTI